MSLLFTVENRVVKPYAETLLLFPFNEIWHRDMDPDKLNAIEDFTYIEFVTSEKKSNPYSGYAASIRREKVKEAVIKRPDWEEDDLIRQGMAALIRFQKEASVTYNYYMSAKAAAEKMQTFFLNFDITEVNIKTGNPLLKPKDITSALNDTAKVLENLSALKTKVDNELFEEVKNKGQKVITPFANPDTL